MPTLWRVGAQLSSPDRITFSSHSFHIWENARESKIFRGIELA
jgi:hypothetical protein